MTPIISAFSDFIWSLDTEKVVILRAEFLKSYQLVPHSCATHLGLYG